MNTKINEVVDKPWGQYKNIYIYKDFAVKILTIFPKKKISLQYHESRSEHWVVTNGVAHVTKGERNLILKENQYIFIGVKEIHRIENRQDNNLIIVEIQTGQKICENDIIRLDDAYGRI